MANELPHFRNRAAAVTIRRMTTDECSALSDDELVHAAYEAAVDVLDVDDALGETMLDLVGELAERFAPEAARSWHEELYADDPPDERHDALESLRRRQAARLLRDALSA